VLRGTKITLGFALFLTIIGGVITPSMQASVATAAGVGPARVRYISLRLSTSPTIQHRLSVAIAALNAPRSDGTITFWLGSLVQPVYTCAPVHGRCAMPWTAATTGAVIIRARWSGDRYFGASQTRARVRVRAARFTETGVLAGVRTSPLTRVVPTPHLSSLAGAHPAGHLTSFASGDPQYRCLRGQAIRLYTVPVPYPDDLLVIAPATHGCRGGAWLLSVAPVVRGSTPSAGPVGTLVALRGHFPRVRPRTGVATILGAGAGAPDGLIEQWTVSQVRVAIPPSLGVRMYGLRLDWFDRVTGEFVHAVTIPHFRVTSTVLRPIIPATTHVLRTVDLQGLVVPVNRPLDPSAPALSLTFAAPDVAVRALRPGDVIATGITPETPLGLLRRVESVAPGSAPGTLTVQTRQATIAEAIRQGTLDVAPALSQASTLAVVPLAPGVQVTSFAPGVRGGLGPHVLLGTGARAGSAAYSFCDTLSLDVLAALKGKERDGSTEHGVPIDEPAEGNVTDPTMPSAPVATPQVNQTPPPQQTLIAAEKTASAAHLPVSPIPAGGATPAPAATIEHSQGVRLAAEVTVCEDIRPHLRIDVAQLWPTPQILTTFHMRARQLGSLRLFGGVYAEFAGQRTLFEHEFDAFVVTVGTVPFVIQPTLLFRLGADGRISAGFGIKTSETLSMDVGVSCTNGDCRQTAFRSPRPNIAHGPLHLTSDNALDAWFEPGVGLRIDGIAIPSMGLRGTVKFQVRPGETPWWKLVGTISLTLSIKFEVIFAEGTFDLALQLAEFPWAEARGGEPMQGSPTPTPGARSATNTPVGLATPTSGPPGLQPTVTPAPPPQLSPKASVPGALLATHPFPGNPSLFALNADRGELFVTHQEGPFLSVVQASTGTTLRTVTIGPVPSGFRTYSVTFAPRQGLIVVTLRPRRSFDYVQIHSWTSGYLALLDSATLQVRRLVLLPFAPYSNLVLDPDHGYLYLGGTHASDEILASISLPEGGTRYVITVGRGGTAGSYLDFDLASDRLIDQGSSQTSELREASTGKLIGHLPVAGNTLTLPGTGHVLIIAEKTVALVALADGRLLIQTTIPGAFALDFGTPIDDPAGGVVVVSDINTGFPVGTTNSRAIVIIDRATGRLVHILPDASADDLGLDPIGGRVVLFNWALSFDTTMPYSVCVLRSLDPRRGQINRSVIYGPVQYGNCGPGGLVILPSARRLLILSFGRSVADSSGHPVSVAPGRTLLFNLDRVEQAS